MGRYSEMFWASDEGQGNNTAGQQAGRYSKLFFETEANADESVKPGKYSSLFFPEPQATPKPEPEPERRSWMRDVFNTTVREGVMRPATAMLQSVARVKERNAQAIGGSEPLFAASPYGVPAMRVASPQAEEQAVESLERVETRAEEALPVSREYQESFMGKLNAGAAQFGGQIAANMAGGPVASGVLMTAQMFDEGYEDALARTGDRDKAMQAGLLNTPAAALDYVGLTKTLKPLFKAGKAPVRALVEGLKGFITEGITEAGQDVWLNVVQKDLLEYAKDEKYVDWDTWESLLIGGILGGVASATAGAVDRSKEQGARSKEQGDTRTKLPVPEVVPTEARSTGSGQEGARREKLLAGLRESLQVEETQAEADARRAAVNDMLTDRRLKADYGLEPAEIERISKDRRAQFLQMQPEEVKLELERIAEVKATALAEARARNEAAAEQRRARMAEMQAQEQQARAEAAAAARQEQAELVARAEQGDEVAIRELMRQEESAANQIDPKEELQERVRAAGRLMHPDTARDNNDPMAGELRDIYESLSPAQKRKLFAPKGQGGKSTDGMRESLSQGGAGFRFETPDALLGALDSSLRGDAVVANYGSGELGGDMPFSKLEYAPERSVQARVEHGQRNAQVIEQKLAPALQQVSTMVPVNVVRTVDDLPNGRLRDAMLQDPDGIEGAWDPDTGKVVLVASNLESTERALEVLAHESIGHVGVRGVLGKDFAPRMAEIFTEYAGNERMQALVQGYGFDVSTEQGRVAAADEYVSRLAEQPDLDPTLWKRVVQWVQEALAKLGLPLKQVQERYGEKRIRELLRQSRELMLGDSNAQLQLGGMDGPAYSKVMADLQGLDAEYMDPVTRDDQGRVITLSERFNPASDDIRFSKKIDPNNPDALEAAAIEAVHSVNTRARTAVVDDVAALEAVEKLVSPDGRALDAQLSGHKAIIMTRNLANVVTAQVEHGALAWNAQKGMFEVPKGRKGLKEIFRPVGRDKKELVRWENWAKVQSARERAARRGMDFAKMDSEELQAMFGKGFTRDFVAAAEGLTKEQRQQYQQVFDGYHEFQGQLLDMLQQSGLINQDQREGLRKVLNYVPFHRDMRQVYQDKLVGKEGGSAQAQASGSVVNQGSPVRGDSRKGSARAINPVFENIVNQVSFFTDAAMKNIAAVKALNVLDVAGLAQKTNGYEARSVRVKAAEVQRKLQKAGVNMDQMDAAKLGDVLEFFTMKVTAEEGVVSVSVKGKREFYKVEDPALLNTLTQMGPAQMTDMLSLVLRTTKNFKTRAVTATPDFAGRNIIRDTLSTWVLYGEKANPFPHFGRVLKGAVQAMGNSAELQSMAASGAGGNMYRPVSKENIYDALRQDKARVQTLLNPVKYWHTWERFLTAFENANRLALREQVLKRGGSEAEANWVAMDILNFSMRGASKTMRTLANGMPFLNARAQGMYKIGRRLEEDPQTLLINGGLMVGASIALWYHNWNDKDEEGEPWYRKLSLTDKLLWYHIRMPGSNNIVRIPKPFEMGALFSSIPELFMDSAVGDEKWSRAAEGVGKLLLDQMNMDPRGNPLIGILVEQFSNKTTLHGRSIVPPDKLDNSPRYQARVDTSATARAVGGALNVSPARLDAVAQALLGGMATYVLAASDLVTSKVSNEDYRPPLRLDRMPVVGGYYRDSRTMTTRYVEEFYELERKINEVYNDARLERMMGQTEKALGMVQDNAVRLSLRDYAGQLKDRLSLLSSARDMNQRSREPMKVKRQVEKDLLIKRNQLLSETDAMLRSIDEGRVSAGKVLQLKRKVLTLTEKEKELKRLEAMGFSRADARLNRERALYGATAE